MSTRRERLEKALRHLRAQEGVWILTHDNPDPDGLAAAYALRELIRAGEEGEGKVQVLLSAGGIIGRAENRALFGYLNVHLHPFEPLHIGKGVEVLLVDTQPRRANNSLPDEIVPYGVIDHHPDWGTCRKVPWKDIRPAYGATSTILTEFLRTSGIPPDRRVATALFYGIASETQDLGRAATRADMRAHQHLYPLMDQTRLTAIDRARVPRVHFRVFRTAIDRGRIHGPLVLSILGKVEYPDMVAEVADFLLRLEEISTAVCIGRYQGEFVFSLRTVDSQLNATEIVRRVVGRDGSGGGHEGMAGGRLPLSRMPGETVRLKEERLKARFLEALGLGEGEGKRLAARPEKSLSLAGS